MIKTSLGQKLSLFLFSFFLFLAVSELLLQFLSLFVSMKHTSLSGSKKTIVCLGDSYTYGIGDETGRSYPEYLEQILRQNSPDIQIINLGKPGSSSSDTLDRYREFLKTAPTHTLVLLTGCNNIWNTPPEKENINFLSKLLWKSRVFKLLRILILRFQSDSAVFSPSSDHSLPDPLHKSENKPDTAHLINDMKLFIQAFTSQNSFSNVYMFRHILDYKSRRMYMKSYDELFKMYIANPGNLFVLYQMVGDGLFIPEIDVKKTVEFCLQKYPEHFIAMETALLTGAKPSQESLENLKKGPYKNEYITKLLLKENKPAEALSFIETHLNFSPSVFIKLLRAQALYSLKKYQEAAALLSSCGFLLATPNSFFYEMHSKNLKNLNFEPVLKDFFQRISFQSLNYSNYIKFASILQEAGEIYYSLELLYRCLYLNPFDESLYYHIAEGMAALHDREYAAEIYEISLKLKPDSSEAFLNLSLLFYELKSQEKSREYWQKFCASENLDPMEETGEFYRDFLNSALAAARELFDTNRLEFSRKIIKVFSSDNNAELLLADVLTDEGFFLEAQETLESIIRKNPDNQDAAEKLSRLYTELSEYDRVHFLLQKRSEPWAEHLNVKSLYLKGNYADALKYSVSNASVFFRFLSQFMGAKITDAKKTSKSLTGIKSIFAEHLLTVYKKDFVNAEKLLLKVSEQSSPEEFYTLLGYLDFEHMHPEVTDFYMGYVSGDTANKNNPLCILTAARLLYAAKMYEKSRNVAYRVIQSLQSSVFSKMKAYEIIAASLCKEQNFPEASETFVEEFRMHFCFFRTIQLVRSSTNNDVNQIEKLFREISKIVDLMKKNNVPDSLKFDTLSYLLNYSTIESNINTIVTLAMENKSKAVLMSYPHNYFANMYLSIIARKYNLQFVDNKTYFDRLLEKTSYFSYFNPDGHCNSTGYKLMAENVYKVIAAP